MKTIILDSLNATLRTISQHKKITVLLFTLQLILFILLLSTIAFFIPKILESTQNILEYSQNIQVNEATAPIQLMQKQLPLGEDPLLIARNYKQLQKNMLLMLATAFAIFSIMNSIIWYVINRTKKQVKNIIQYLRTFLLMSIVVFGAILFFMYSILNTLFSTFLGKEKMLFIPFLIISILLLYTFYITIPLIGNTERKKLVKTVKQIAVKKAPIMIVTYGIIIAVLAACIYLIGYTVEGNLAVVIAIIILTIFMFTTTKIFLFQVVQKIKN